MTTKGIASINKMDLPDALRNDIIAALANGRMPALTTSHRYMLTFQRRSITLVDRDGEPTAAGRFVYERLGQEIPTDNAIDQGKQPYRKGPGEYAKDASGREVKLRSLQADGRTWKYTGSGRLFYSVPTAQVVLHIPVICSGINSQGDEYHRDEYLPVSHRVNVSAIALNSHLTDAQKREQMKA